MYLSIPHPLYREGAEALSAVVIRNLPKPVLGVRSGFAERIIAQAPAVIGQEKDVPLPEEYPVLPSPVAAIFLLFTSHCADVGFYSAVN
jgi:hypothetical protein